MTRELSADHQLVHGLRALVGDHRLQIQRMPDGRVFERDARAAEQVAGFEFTIKP